MASPFPGMDPYLENPALWQGFHNLWIGSALRQLQPILPDHYVATLEMRIYFERADGDSTPSRVPDLELVRTGPSPTGQTVPSSEYVALSGFLVNLHPVEIREAYLTIRDLSAKEVVTCLELLSPSNKRTGEGRDLYRLKQTQMFAGGVNIVEVDLLRGGAHSILPAAEDLADLPPFHYVASVYQVTHALQCQVFPWTVREMMPVIPIPLAPGDEGIRLDLQQAFQDTFTDGAYKKLLDYQADPTPPLAPEDAAWADALLREAALRGAPSA